MNLFKLSLAGVTFLALGANASAASDPPLPDTYLVRVKEIGEPDFDASRKTEDGYLDNYKREQHLLYQQKAAILLELCRAHPDDPRYAEWMSRRWVLLGWNQNPETVAEEVLADITTVTTSETKKQVLQNGAYWTAYFGCHANGGDAHAMRLLVEDFAKRYPNDQRIAELLTMVAEDHSADRTLQIEMYERLAKQYATTHYGQFAPGMVRRLQSLGKAFELVFDDAITGKRVSIEDWKGKVVVIDFWATTCVPCVAEMPQLKEVYAKYHRLGVEFVGVSLDESEADGGLSALRRFVKKHSIPWPQFYQGNGYDSAFSKSYGVGSAPTVFVLDRDGRLLVTEAQQDLESVIKKLLEGTSGR